MCSREYEKKNKKGQKKMENGKGRAVSTALEEIEREIEREFGQARLMEREKYCTAEAFDALRRILEKEENGCAGRESVVCRINYIVPLSEEETFRQMELLATAVNRAIGEGDIFFKSGEKEYTVLIEYSLTEHLEPERTENRIQREFKNLGGREDCLEFKKPGP